MFRHVQVDALLRLLLHHRLSTQMPGTYLRNMQICCSALHNVILPYALLENVTISFTNCRADSFSTKHEGGSRWHLICIDRSDRINPERTYCRGQTRGASYDNRSFWKPGARKGEVQDPLPPAVALPFLMCGPWGSRRLPHGPHIKKFLRSAAGAEESSGSDLNSYTDP